jgi:hypothetical protein
MSEADAVKQDLRGHDKLGSPELLSLRTAAAVRQRCGEVFNFVAAGHSPYFAIEEGRLDDVAGFVATVTREAYPDRAVPFHSRWRHFEAGGIDRWADIRGMFDTASTETAATGHPDTALPRHSSMEAAQAAIDLATVSVLLDAGAGDAWRYCERETGLVFTRSEGLAIASLHAFRSGLFSGDPKRPCQVDDTGLSRLTSAALAGALQVSPDNPLVGSHRRVLLLQRLGKAQRDRPDLFGQAPARPGHIIDRVRQMSADDSVAAPMLLEMLLDALSPIWPSGLIVDGVALGDAGRHPAVRTGDRSDGLVPFHKLSQWLTYSMIEPLNMAGLDVRDIDGLTALAEYRNGGLLLDLGVIRPRIPIEPAMRLDVSSQLVVEWRALTVALIDRLLEPVRLRLGLGAEFLLPHLLQGGTWSAGRKCALALRPPDGPPPLTVGSDGTTF